MIALENDNKVNASIKFIDAYNCLRPTDQRPTNRVGEFGSTFAYFAFCIKFEMIQKLIRTNYS